MNYYYFKLYFRHIVSIVSKIHSNTKYHKKYIFVCLPVCYSTKRNTIHVVYGFLTKHIKKELFSMGYIHTENFLKIACIYLH